MEKEKMTAMPPPYVTRMRHSIVNSYFVADSKTEGWIVVDTGFKSSARHIIRVAQSRFGTRRPLAIFLTHGHFDHVGSALKLADYWNVPIYAHPLEHPYLTGLSNYPPSDPTVGGGFIASVMSRFFPEKPVDLGQRLKSLPMDGTIPGISDWRWIHTPGHSPGHISLFRDSDSTLIAGDAFVTTRQESLLSILSQHREVSRPPAYFTPDWSAAFESIKKLAALKPNVAATGHGLPMGGPPLISGLEHLIANFDALKPSHGRYISHPAQTDERGVISVPSPVPDLLPKIAAVLGAALLVGVTVRRYRSR